MKHEITDNKEKYRQYNTIQKKNQSKSKLAINRFGLQNKHETAKWNS